MDTTTVKGIGPAIATQLAEIGIRNAHDLARADPAVLTKVSGIGPVRAMMLIAEARDVVSVLPDGQVEEKAASPAPEDKTEAPETAARKRAKGGQKKVGKKADSAKKASKKERGKKDKAEKKAKKERGKKDKDEKKAKKNRRKKDKAKKKAKAQKRKTSDKSKSTPTSKAGKTSKPSKTARKGKKTAKSKKGSKSKKA